MHARASSALSVLIWLPPGAWQHLLVQLPLSLVRLLFAFLLNATTHDLTF